MFKRLFGGSKDAPPAPQSKDSAQKTIDTIQRLIDNENNLEKRKELIEKRIEQELEKAKAYTKQQKKAQALQCLKKKKLLEQEVTNLDNMIMQVIVQRQNLEGQRATVETVAAMREAARQAQTNLKQVNIESVDKVLEEIADTNDQMRQIQEAMGQAPAGLDLDDDELLADLEELEATERDKELLEPAHVPVTKVPAAGAALPAAPNKPVTAKVKTQEEEELEALEREMALAN